MDQHTKFRVSPQHAGFSMMEGISFRSDETRAAFRDLPRSVQVYTIGFVVMYLLAVWLLPKGSHEVIFALVAIFATATLLQPFPRYAGEILVPNLAFVLMAILLWRPGEVLIGSGLGTFVGLLLFRKSEFWLACLNGAAHALTIVAATVLARLILPIGSSADDLIRLVLAALVSTAAYGVLHGGLLASYRILRFQHPFIPNWLHHFARNPGNQLIATPLAIVLSGVHLRLSSDAVGLVLTAACALALPLARQELAYYHQSQQMLEEIVETIIRVLDRMMPGAREHSERVSAIAVETGLRLGLPEQALITLRLAARLHDVGLLTGPATSGPLNKYPSEGGTPNSLLDHFPDRVIAAIIQAHHARWIDREGHKPQRRTLISLAGSILAAAELYDSARAGFRPFDRPVSQEAVERELTTLAGSTLDPEVVPVVLRVGHELTPELIGAPY